MQLFLVVSSLVAALSAAVEGRYYFPVGRSVYAARLADEATPPPYNPDDSPFGGAILLSPLVSEPVGLDQNDEPTRKPPTILSYGPDDGRLLQDEGAWVIRNGKIYAYNGTPKFRSYPVPIITGRRSAYAFASRQYETTRQPRLSKETLAALLGSTGVGDVEPRKFDKIPGRE